MTLLCFLLDLRNIPFPLLCDLKECLLQLANLYAVTCRRGKEDEIPTLRDLIGLCYISGGESYCSSPELKIAYRPGQSFSLRGFHYAVNSLPMDCFLPESNKKVEVSLTNLVSDKALYTWGGDNIGKKVIAVSTTLFTDGEAFLKSLMDASEHCVAVDFVVLEQEDLNLSDDASEKLSRFISSPFELANCTLCRYYSESSVLCGLAKKWLRELRNDKDESLHAVFLFKNSIVGTINQIFCNFFASSNQIVDGVSPSQACRCHGFCTRNAVSNMTKGSFCPVTQRELRKSDLIETAVRIGEQTLLFLPSLDCAPQVRRVSAPLTFNVIERTNLASMSEGLIWGTSYVVTPTCHPLDAAPDNSDKTNINSQIFLGLCEALFQLDQALVCSSFCNTETMTDGAFQCFYLLQPSDRGPMLLRRIAGAEEVVPNPDIDQAGLVIPEETKNSVHSALSLLELRDYNPLQHERGFHQKMNWIVRESLQLGSFPETTETSLELHNPTCEHSSDQLQQQQPPPPPSLIRAPEKMQRDQNKLEDSTYSCTTDDWEQLLIIDDMNDDYSSATIPKTKTQSSLKTQSARPLDDKTSRILERLEAPKQLNQAAAAPSLMIRRLMNNKPSLPFDSGCSQPIKPYFPDRKRKR